MATYKVKSQGKQYTVTVVDKAIGGGTVTIDDREFDVEFIGAEESSTPPTLVEAVSVAASTPQVAATPRPAAAVPVSEAW